MDAKNLNLQETLEHAKSFVANSERSLNLSKETWIQYWPDSKGIIHLLKWKVLCKGNLKWECYIDDELTGKRGVARGKDTRQEAIDEAWASLMHEIGQV